MRETSGDQRGAEPASALTWRTTGILIGIQISWFSLTSAGQSVTLRLERVLDAISLPATLLARVLDVWIVLPVFAALVYAVLRVAPTPGRDRAGRAELLRLGVVFATSVAIAAIFFAHRDYLLHRLGTVREGVLYRSAQLGEGTLGSVIERHGIRTIAILRNDPEVRRREEALARKLGIQFTYIPMGDTQAGVESFLSLMEDPENHPVLAHCRYGVARTGVAGAAFRMQFDGWENERALAEARRYGGYDTLEEGSDKREFILNFEPQPARAKLPPPAPTSATPH